MTSLVWSFDIEGDSNPGSNCPRIDASADINHDGMVTISASAGGVSVKVDVPIQ